MWFGTETGLYRYDGYHTAVINTHSGTLKLSSDQVRALYEDRQGNLWIGTHNGLQRLSPDRKAITTYLATLGTGNRKTVNAITEMHDGTIWCSADDGYLYRSTDKKSFSRIPDAFFSDSGGTPRIILHITEDENHNVWVADNLYGFQKLNLSGQTLEKFPPAEIHNEKLIAAYADKSKLFYTHKQAVFTYSALKNKFKVLVHTDLSNLLNDPVRYVYQDKKGFKWLVTQSKLIRIAPDAKQIDDLTPQFMNSGASYFNIDCIYEDKHGQLWLGSYFGVYRLKNQTGFFKTITLPKGFGSNPYFSTRGLIEADNGNLFIGSYSGFFRYNRANNNFKEYKLKHDTSWVNPLVRAMVTDTNGQVWLATEANGLLQFNPQTEIFRFYPGKTAATAKTNAPLLPTHNISLLKDAEGLLWLGSYDNLYTLNPQNGQAWPVTGAGNKKVFSALKVMAIHQGRDKSIWVGTDYGLYRIRKEQGSIVHYTATAPGIKKSGLTHNFINCIYEDQAGKLWLGTKGGGINVFNPANGRVEAQYTIQDGLADNKVCAILPGAANHLWISTYNGLSRLDLQHKAFRNFYTNDGLLTNEFNQGSALAGTDGNLYFGSMDGIIYFNPNKHLPPKQESQVMLTKLVQHKGQKNKIEETTLAINSLKQIKLHYQDKFLTVYFAPKNYFEPANGHYRFAYRLTGLTNEWQNIGATNYIQLAGLPAGDYTLSIKAMGSNGRWGKALKIPVLVGEAFYLTTGAYLVYALIAIGFIAIIFWFQLSRLRLQNKLTLEHMQKEKLEELNALKTQFFTNITHEFRTPLTLILSPLEQLQAQPTLPPPQTIKQQHTIIYRNAQRLLRLINQLLDLAKLEAGSMGRTEIPGDIVAFVGQVVQTFRLQAQKKDILLQYNAETKPRAYLFDADKLEQIISNLLSNALKFTPAGGKVQLNLAWTSSAAATGDLLHLRVTDTGMGIPEGELPFVFDRFYQVNDHRTRSLAGSGLGLSLVKELSELLGGHVEVESLVEKETTFTVTLPVRVADNLTAAEPMTVEPITAPEEEIIFTQTQAATDAPIILVVEDHDELRAFIGQGLADKYRVIMAANGAEGWELTQQVLPDLIIADVAMPQMDGYTLSQLVKSTPLTNHIAVILLTARTATENRVQGLSAGANDYLTKPFNQQELQLRVANWLRYQQTLHQYWYQKFNQAHPDDLPDSLPEKPVADPFLQEVYRILNLELANSSFGVDRLASEMMVSTRTLHRKLAALTGMNANTLIRTYRLQKAAVLLQEGHSVSEAADLAGFEGLSYFSKCFKEHFSVSPSQYIVSQVKQ